MEKTYEEMILAHLQRFETLTDAEARERFGTNRAAAVIFKLREKGYKINTEMVAGKNRYGRKVRYGVYRYVGK